MTIGLNNMSMGIGGMIQPLGGGNITAMDDSLAAELVGGMKTPQ